MPNSLTCCLRPVKILWRSGSVWRYLLAASTPVYAGGVVGAPALPLWAPPTPLPLGAVHLLRIVMTVQQQLLLLLHYRGLDLLGDPDVGVDGQLICLL